MKFISIGKQNEEKEEFIRTFQQLSYSGYGKLQRIYDRYGNSGCIGVTGPVFLYSETWQLVINTETMKIVTYQGLGLDYLSPGKSLSATGEEYG